MQYGLGVLDRPSVRDQITLAQLAERSGFTSIWVCETRLARDAISVMGAIAASTTSIRIGSGVVNTWSRNPALMAMTFATLNNLAPGRIVMGLGAYWEPLASKQGIHRVAPLRQMREYIGVVRRLLALESGVTFESDLVQVHDLTLDLGHGDAKVPQDVPIYIGGTGPKMMQLTGEIADGTVINGLLRPEYVEDCLEQMRIGAESAGRDFNTLRRPGFVNVALDENGDRAREHARRLLAMYLGQQPHIAKASGLPEEFLAEVRAAVGGWPAAPGGLDRAMHLVTDEIALNQTVAGTVDECREQLQKWEKTGIDEIVIVPLTHNYADMIEAFRP